MKQLNEYSLGYPTSITNSQSQEYSGVFAPIDAEVVQGKDRLNPRTSDGLHRLNTFINYQFKRITLNPQHDIAELRVRLNHLNLDFPFNANEQLQDVNTYIVTQGGNAFGVTPTTDLRQGFDRGLDLPRYQLEIRMIPTQGGFKLDGKLTPFNEVSEGYINSSKRTKRVGHFKNFLDKKKK